jgi:hypothetical protein
MTTMIEQTKPAVSFTTITQIERDSIERTALEMAALIVEDLQGNPTYMQAWRLAARAIRRAKPD